MTKLLEIQLGDTVVVKGLDCASGEKVIKQNQDGDLYFDCEKGGHYIHMMVDAHGDVPELEVK